MSSAGSIPSNLSDARYGYDFSVAVTQQSINSSMKDFIAKLQEPIVEICYVADNNGNPVLTDIATVKQKANGVDPFSVPANADVTGSDLQNLFNGARFMMGFRAQIGLPSTTANLPDMVTLGTTSASVGFNLYCSTFTVVQYSPPSGWGGTASWLNISQDPSNPWVFSSSVDLRLETVEGTLYNTLPPNVQQQISNLGSSAFSVQQLLFDLTNAKLESVPTLSSNVVPGTPLYTVLQETFLGAYFAQMQAEGQPLLGCNIVASDTPASTLQPTSLDLMVNPYIDDTGKVVGGTLTTLNYLCDVGGKPLPTPTNFSWNWVPDQDANADHDGVVSINRSWFVNYLQDALTPSVAQNCLAVTVKVTGTTPDYNWTIASGQMPTITTPATGATVLTFNYTSSSSDEAGLNGAIGSMTLQNNYTMNVQFVGTTIQISQHQVVYAKISHVSTSGDGNIVDKTIVDTYKVSVDSATGSLQFQQVLPSGTTDSSKNPKTNPFLNFFTNLDSLMDNVENSVRTFTNTTLNIPVATAQNFVFPGGKTFSFKDAGFSSYQDLVAYISYTDA